MATKITDIAYHQAKLDDHAADNIRRLDLDVSDCALSTWGSDCMMRAHRTCIRALEYGVEHGIDGPATDIEVLVREDDTIVNAKLIRTKYGYCWILDSDAEKEFGRKFIPAAKSKCSDDRDENGDLIGNIWTKVPGRIMKGFKLHEEMRVVEASEWLEATDPGFIGGSISYYTVPKNKDWFYRGGR